MLYMGVLISACIAFSSAAVKEYWEETRLGKGIPVPHAEFLEGLIKKMVFPLKSKEETFLDVYGDVPERDNATADRLLSLEYSVLDFDNLKLYAQLARRGVQRERRPTADGRRLFTNILNRYDGHIIRTLMKLMQQSLYSTRMLIARTNNIRLRYQSDIPYNIGILYGMLLQMTNKAGRVASIMYQLHKRDTAFKFVWYLLLYERMLQLHTDSVTNVMRIFDFNSRGAKNLLKENTGNVHLTLYEKQKKEFAGIMVG